MKQLAVEACIEIGAELMREALWCKDECTWAGLRKYGSGKSDICGYVLKGDLYGGSAGVSYFLTELFGVTNDAIFRQFALGGLRHALAHASDLIEQGSLGLFDGATGIALAATICSYSLKEEELAVKCGSLRDRIREVAHRARGYDVISGIAGIASVEAYYDRAGLAPDHANVATRLADLLVRTGERLNGARSWPAGLGGEEHLTGYAHGAAGISAALLEVYATCSKKRYLSAAMQAIDFECQSFDKKRRNWPDLRRRYSGIPPIFGDAWCHGSAGILLSRISAARFSSSQGLQDDIKLALAAVTSAATRMLRMIESDCGLCHGVAGLMTILKVAATYSGKQAALVAADELASHLIRVRRRMGCWPTTLSKVENTPQLMTGVAGVGHGLLQAYALSTLPFVLDVAFRPLGQDPALQGKGRPSGVFPDDPSPAA
jgi:lantibiotic modifying enzyme